MKSNIKEKLYVFMLAILKRKRNFFGFLLFQFFFLKAGINFSEGL